MTTEPVAPSRPPISRSNSDLKTLPTIPKSGGVSALTLALERFPQEKPVQQSSGGSSINSSVTQTPNPALPAMFQKNEPTGPAPAIVHPDEFFKASPHAHAQSIVQPPAGMPGALAAAAASSAGSPPQAGFLENELALQNLKHQTAPPTASEPSSVNSSTSNPSEYPTPRPPRPQYHQPQSRASSPPPRVVDKRRPVSGQTAMRFIDRFGQQKPSDSFQSAKDWSVEKSHKGNGGLRNAVNRYCTATNNKKLWVGTLGMPSDELGDVSKTEIIRKLAREYDSVPVFAPDNTFEAHYTHYCKGILWPTLHYQTPDSDRSKAYHDHSWEHYKALNQMIADKVIEVYKRGDVIWIHDYHLLLVPEMVRQQLPNARIGMFLHVTFPSSEVFRCLAARNELLTGMLGATCIGFQTAEYGRHFLQTCNRLLVVDASVDGVENNDGRFTAVVACPIGIDPPSLQKHFMDPEVDKWRRLIRARWPGKRLLVSRDKLDSLRGIKQKLLAYEHFLINNREFCDNVVLVQVCLSGNESDSLEGELVHIMDRINALTDDLSNQQVIFLHQDIEFEQYLAMLAEAEAYVALSLREGMNLTCHEFILCSKDNSGQLILSEFTGSASVLDNDDIQVVNPWNMRQVSDAYKTALTMDKETREKHRARLVEFVEGHTCLQWATTFLRHLEDAWVEHQKSKRLLPRLNIAYAKERYDIVAKQPGKYRLFLLNLEGRDFTSPHHSKPVSSSAAVYSSTHNRIPILTELVSDPYNVVYIISSDARHDIERLFRNVPNLGIIAENGGYLRPYRSDQWIRMCDEEDVHNWKDSVLAVLESIKERNPGSSISGDETSITFQFTPQYSAEQEQDFSFDFAGEAVSHINDAFSSQNITARFNDDRILVENQQLSRLAAVKRAVAIFEKTCKIGGDVETKGNTSGHLTVAPSSPTLTRTRSYTISAPGPSYDATISYVFVAGNDQSDYPVIEWANSLGDVETVLTVGLHSEHSPAAVSVEGLNGLTLALRELAVGDRSDVKGDRDTRERTP